jgi:hypothetical protein
MITLCKTGPQYLCSTNDFGGPGIFGGNKTTQSY